MFQAQQNIYSSSQKLDLIRHSLEVHRQQLPPESSIASEVKQEIDSTQSMSPGNMTFTNIGENMSNHSIPRPDNQMQRQHRSSVSFSRAAAVTGKLEVRLNNRFLFLFLNYSQIHRCFWFFSCFFLKM